MAEIAVAVGAIVLVLFTNPLWLVGLSSAGVLTYYAIGHLSALRQPEAERIVWRIVPVLGLVLCALLVATLPWQSLLAAVVSAALGSLWFLIRRATAKS
jgi:APA family basic amino acid/polyamine antiporter